MKKVTNVFSKSALLIAAVFCLYNCGETTKKKENQLNEVAMQASPPEDMKAPANIISLEEADAIYENYGKHRIPAIESYETQKRSPKQKFEAARFVDFDYQTIKDYIAYVDQEAKKAGVKEVTKLRLYFANYPDQAKFSDGKKVVHPRQNSIFMLPTLAYDNGNYGFYIDKDGKAKLIKDWKPKTEKGMGVLFKSDAKSEASLLPNFFTNSSLQGGQSLIMNRGNGGPPPVMDF